MRSLLVSLILALTIAATTAAAPTKVTSTASVFTFNKVRTVEMIGVVDDKMTKEVTARFLELINKSTKQPIDILINSIGGSVTHGANIIDAMTMAKHKGIKLRCIVPRLALSMGANILNHCSERFALPGAILMWHEIRVNYAFSFREMQTELEANKYLEEHYINTTVKALNVPKEVFMRHYINQTTWAMPDFVVFSPNYLKVVDVAEGNDNIFKIEKDLTIDDLLRTLIPGAEYEIPVW